MCSIISIHACLSKYIYIYIYIYILVQCMRILYISLHILYLYIYIFITCAFDYSFRRIQTFVSIYIMLPRIEDHELRAHITQSYIEWVQRTGPLSSYIYVYIHMHACMHTYIYKHTYRHAPICRHTPPGTDCTKLMFLALSICILLSIYIYKHIVSRRAHRCWHVNNTYQYISGWNILVYNSDCLHTRALAAIRAAFHSDLSVSIYPYLYYTASIYLIQKK